VLLENGRSTAALPDLKIQNAARLAIGKDGYSLFPRLLHFWMLRKKHITVFATPQTFTRG
jgi:hypothetical protein